MHAFLSNLANRQIDRQTDIAGNRFTSSVVEVNERVQFACHRKQMNYGS